MSEAAHVPFTETKAPESAERLHRLYSIFLVRRDPGLGDRVGSIVADE